MTSNFLAPKSIYVAILLTLTSSQLLSSTAMAVTCGAQLIHTICGDGKIELTLSETDLSFNLTNGDVHCWMMAAEIAGTAVKTAPTYPFFLPDNFELFGKSALLTKPKFGTFSYDPEIKKGRLTLDQKSFTSPMFFINSEINLDCQ